MKDIDTYFYIKSTFFVFIIIWTIIIVVNNLLGTPAYPIVFIPYLLFFIGFINSQYICDCDIQEDVLSTSFLHGGLIIFVGLFTLYNKEKHNKYLSKIIYTAIIFTLMSYYHIWVPKDKRIVCKIVRSCFEVMAITLYIYSICAYINFS